MPLPTINPSEPGPLIQYLVALAENPATRHHAIEARDAIRDVLGTPKGAILLDLLRKSTFERLVPTNENSSALVARNAQSFIAHDLRRIMSDELDALFEGHSGDGPGRRDRKRR